MPARSDGDELVAVGPPAVLDQSDPQRRAGPMGLERDSGSGAGAVRVIIRLLKRMQFV